MSVAQKTPRPDFIRVEEFSFHYGEKQAIFGIDMAIPENEVTALIGPSGCGKSTLLRNMNRMNDLIDGVRHEGDIRLDGVSLYDPSVEVISLRKRVGMVFQKYNPFAKSIYENVVFSLRVAGRSKKSELDETVERSLKDAALWDEVMAFAEVRLGLPIGTMKATVLIETLPGVFEMHEILHALLQRPGHPAPAFVPPWLGGSCAVGWVVPGVESE
jgi:ABC-type phosphate transport system ATPase subunit